MREINEIEAEIKAIEDVSEDTGFMSYKERERLIQLKTELYKLLNKG